MCSKAPTLCDNLRTVQQRHVNFRCFVAALVRPVYITATTRPLVVYPTVLYYLLLTNMAGDFLPPVYVVLPNGSFIADVC